MDYYGEWRPLPRRHLQPFAVVIHAHGVSGYKLNAVFPGADQTTEACLLQRRRKSDVGGPATVFPSLIAARTCAYGQRVTASATHLLRFRLTWLLPHPAGGSAMNDRKRPGELRIQIDAHHCELAESLRQRMRDDLD